MEKIDFINGIKEGALKGKRDYDILPSVTIAQAILESGWGKSALSEKAKNLFGVKAFSNWPGQRITLVTTEWYNGQKVTVNADFRAYESFDESIEDHNKLLSNLRYKPVRQSQDYKAACRELYKCGYATDPQYPDKLINIIETYRLYEFDASIADKEAAVDACTEKTRKFQQLCNALGIRDYEGKALKEDNILGERTKSSIGRMPVLKLGSKGEAVRFVQEVLGASPVDGKFGTITEGVVMDFQKRKFIEADGVVGIETWKTMIKE